MGDGFAVELRISRIVVDNGTAAAENGKFKSILRNLIR
jgi:hypothetical protein